MFAFCFDYGSFAIVSFQSYLNINDVKSVSPCCLITITASHSHSPPSSLLRLSSFHHVFVGVVNVRVVIFHICDGAFIVTSSFVRLVSLSLSLFCTLRVCSFSFSLSLSQLIVIISPIYLHLSISTALSTSFRTVTPMKSINWKSYQKPTSKSRHHILVYWSLIPSKLLLLSLVFFFFCMLH